MPVGQPPSWSESNFWGSFDSFLACPFSLPPIGVTACRDQIRQRIRRRPSGTRRSRRANSRDEQQKSSDAMVNAALLLTLTSSHP
ncbi:hypothetical protein RB3790 [Rhodopirellula baltica SH 1]|uniref:Uncharacterized protein n=1 Tax=Rhodopirellula baltica (strain DSM 10527 / NCIMB 13988 / SH1) TaxID=243090 RepID=Q7UTM5_RHOBA|nr:hypothetical protein RB3790 [Rhodopirellula baltica SH 1]